MSEAIEDQLNFGLLLDDAMNKLTQLTGLKRETLGLQKIEAELNRLFKEKSKLYGNSWKSSNLNENGRGVSAMFVMINTKYDRLKALCWDGDPNEYRARIRETLRDVAVYSIISMLLVEMDMTVEDWDAFDKIEAGG